MTEVRYRDIAGFPGYRVGSDGSVWSRRRPYGHGSLNNDWKRMKPGNSGNGYLVVSLYRKPNEKVTLLVHILVLEAFTGPKPSRHHETCHYDGDRGNNNHSNLRWGTRKENAADRQRHGSPCGYPGEKNPLAKLNDEMVNDIRRKRLQGVPGKTLAREYRVSKALISVVSRGLAWTHLPQPR